MTKRGFLDRKISKFQRKPLGDPAQLMKSLVQRGGLTERDFDMLTAIYRHRILTTNQLCEMFFRFGPDGKERSRAEVVARRRLRKLFDFKLVERFFVDVGRGKGSSPAHVMLDASGAKLVASRLGMSLKELKYKSDMNDVELPFLKHVVEVNQFYIWLLTAARKQKHDIQDFVTEHLCRQEFTFQTGKRFVVNPDAYWQHFTSETGGYHAYLEWDRGTESPLTFQKKQARYAAFYASEDFERQFPSVDFPLVLTVAPSPQRAIQLREAICAVDKTDIRWLFTSAQMARQNILGRIWIGKDLKPISLNEV